MYLWDHWVSGSVARMAISGVLCKVLDFVKQQEEKKTNMYFMRKLTNFTCVNEKYYQNVIGIKIRSTKICLIHVTHCIPVNPIVKQNVEA